MNIDTLKQAWDASVSATPADDTLASLTRQARTGAQRYRRGMRLRIVYGVVAFCLALGLLGTLAMVPGVWLGMRVAMLLWGAGLIACVAGLWPLWKPSTAPADAPLQAQLQACLHHVDRELAYYRSLRWRWWLPFGLGLASALIPRLSPQPNIGWLLGLGALLGCGWGFVHGPRHQPARLRSEAAMLHDTLAQMQTGNRPEV